MFKDTVDGLKKTFNNLSPAGKVGVGIVGAAVAFVGHVVVVPAAIVGGLGYAAVNGVKAINKQGPSA